MDKNINYINLSGEFLNKHKELHTFENFWFDEDGVYRCYKDENGLINRFEEY